MGDVIRENVVCGGCGSAQSSGASHCPICSKLLSEDYEPLDVIRSGYGLHGKKLTSETEVGAQDLFAQNRNGIAETAQACLVYSLVPYLGILFIPLAVSAGAFGFAVARRSPAKGGSRLAIACVSLSFLVLTIQVFLWWLLYIVPSLGTMPQ